MTCPTVDPSARENAGPDPTGTRYPFVDPGPDVKGVFADAYVSYATRDVVPPLRLVWLSGFDLVVNCGTVVPGTATTPTFTPANSADVVVWDGAGQEVFNSTAAVDFRASSFGPRMFAYHWTTAGGYCRLVQHTAWARASDQVLLPQNWNPTRAVLDAWCCQRNPKSVTRVGILGPSTGLASRMMLATGYNTTLEADPVVRGLRQATVVTLTATAGAGLGRVPPDCAPAAVDLATLNGVSPDANGNLNLEMGGCYYARQPSTKVLEVAYPVEATLKLGNDCKACVSCEDFEAAQDSLRTVWQSLVDTGGVVAGAACALKDLVARWTTQKSCRESGLVQVVATPTGGVVDVLVGVCNPGSDCLTAAVLDLLVAFTPGTSSTTHATAVANTAFTSDGRGRTAAVVPVAQTDGSYQVTWPVIPPRANVVFQCRFLLTLPAAPPAGGPVVLTAAVTQTPTGGSSTPYATGTKTVTATLKWDL